MKSFRLASAVVVMCLFLTQPVSGQSLPGAPVESKLVIQTQARPIARQGDAVVTSADMDAYLSRMQEEHRSAFLHSRDRIGQAIENLMLPRLLVEQARNEGFLQSEMLHANLYQSAVVLIGQEYMNQYFQAQELEDYSQVAREIYLTEPERFRTPERVSFTHILVSVDSERGELDAMEQIFSIYERLSEGDSIDELATALSDDPSVSENEGRFHSREPGELDQAVAQSLSLMQPGQISEPVRSQFGWHVLRLDEFHEARPLEWEEAEEQAIEAARLRHMERARERLVQRLRADQLVVDPEAVQGILDRYQVDWKIVPEDAAGG